MPWRRPLPRVVPRHAAFHRSSEPRELTMRTVTVPQMPDGREVGAVGLGCMGMSWIYREDERDDRASTAVLREALDLGATMLDTADIYGDGHNEELVGNALRGRRSEAFLATKGGLVGGRPRQTGTAPRRIAGPSAHRAGGQPAQAAHRLGRPVLPAPARPRGAAARQLGRAGRTGPGGQGAQYRTVRGHPGRGRRRAPGAPGRRRRSPSSRCGPGRRWGGTAWWSGASPTGPPSWPSPRWGGAS